ncbi:hypothetical protein [Stenotrophomonas nitritireducens]|uniref:hypothetical protein n=1 Tax=Stenotrophomonas nitritireducens TaxID=83617 RepID=UPI003D969F16
MQGGIADALAKGSGRAQDDAPLRWAFACGHVRPAVGCVEVIEIQALPRGGACKPPSPHWTACARLRMCRRCMPRCAVDPVDAQRGCRTCAQYERQRAALERR